MVFSKNFWLWYWRIDAYFFIAFGMSLLCIAAEKLWGVLSGFTLWLGPIAAMLFALSMIFFGAGLILWVVANRVDALAPQPGVKVDDAVKPKATVRAATTGRPIFTNETPIANTKPTVRTQPRTPTQRSAASRAVMSQPIY